MHFTHPRKPLCTRILCCGKYEIGYTNNYVCICTYLGILVHVLSMLVRAFEGTSVSAKFKESCYFANGGHTNWIYCTQELIQSVREVIQRVQEVIQRVQELIQRVQELIQRVQELIQRVQELIKRVQERTREYKVIIPYLQ